MRTTTFEWLGNRVDASLTSESKQSIDQSLSLLIDQRNYSNSPTKISSTMAPKDDAPKDDYVLTRDFLDNNRINYMNSLWTKVFGYLLHPKIPTDSPDIRIADVGTGTGIWLFDVRDVVSPSARLEGFDISFDAAPPAETLPSNVTFRHWDVKEDLPEDLVGVFDVVHVRFFSFVLLADQVPPVIQKLFKMLSTFLRPTDLDPVSIWWPMVMDPVAKQLTSRAWWLHPLG